jgi:hypothetical protein
MKIDVYPSERLVEAANLINGLAGIKLNTRIKNGDRCLVLEIPGIKNKDFESAIGRVLSRDTPYGKKELVRIFKVIRLIDPILSEFKKEYRGEHPQEYFVDLSDVVDGSCNEAGEITLEIGSADQPADTDWIEFAFMEELIHHLQFQSSVDPDFAVNEDKQSMIDLAYRDLPNSWIPQRYEKLRERFKP